VSESNSVEKRILESLKSKFGESILEDGWEGALAPKRIKTFASREKIVEVAQAIKELGFDQVISQGGTDYPKDDIFKVNYHLIAVDNEELKPIILSLATKLPRNDPKMSTLTNVWRSAEFHEQETFENFGIFFEGHPRMERLLLPEDWDDIPPLRKEFTLPGR